MHSEVSPQHQMSGNLPPRNREELREKYNEVVLENPGDLTMYTWAQMQALELLPGRVPANESGFHFPGVIRGITMELVQKRPFDYTYNQAMNMVKNYVIPKTVINLNLESVYFSLGYEKKLFHERNRLLSTWVSLPKYRLLSTWITVPKYRLLSTWVTLPKYTLLSTWITLPKYRLLSTWISLSTCEKKIKKKNKKTANQ